MGTTGGNELPRFEPTGGGDGAGIMERILVSVRLRPLNAREIELKEASDWECINDNTIIFKNSTVPAAYTYDRVFGSECTTKQVYEEGAKEVALSVVSGINSSIFAYGQTSSGKTYTMRGVTEYSMADIYDYIQKHSERKFILKFSAIEIYNESVKDLLSTDSTPLRLLDDPEKGTIVDKLTEETIEDQSHLKKLLSFCEAQRQIGETSLNEMSSRSHQILRLTIESSAQEFLSKDNISTLAATVNFVDLAGSERASQALTAGARLKEGCHINRSLLTLSTVIRKLSKGRIGHVPYRDSKLTRILQNSLGGNARTAIICTMSPARSHVEQSRNSLLFASCAKQVSTNAQVNVVMSDKALVKHLQRELARLESELKCPGLVSHSDALREKETQIKKMEKEMEELVQQRDLAQSRLDYLLRVVGEDRPSRQEDESNHGSSMCEDVVSLSETSDVAYQIPEIYFTSIQTLHESNNQHEQHLQLFDKSKEHLASSPRQSFSSLRFAGNFPHQGEDEIAKAQSVDSDHCKDVCCIEENESLTSRSNKFDFLVNEDGDSLLPPSLNNKNNEDHEEIPEEVLLPVTIEDDSREDCKPKNKGVLLAITLEDDWHEDCELKTKEVLLPVTLEEERHGYCEPKTKEVLLPVTLEDDKHEDCEPKTKGVLLPPICDDDDNHEDDDELKTKGKIDMNSALEQQVLSGTETENLVKSYPDELSLQSLPIDLPSSGSLTLPRSRSCRVALETKPASLCFQELEKNNNVPSSGFLKDIPGRSGGVQRRTLSAVSYGDHTESLSGEGYQASERCTDNNVLKEQNGETSKEGIVNHSGFLGELKEMAQVQFQKQLINGQEMEWRVNEWCGPKRNVKDADVDSMKHPSKLLTRWPFEFETKQWEIIEFWHACHVSLVHRTCFFLLFKGDPEDSIYMEIEHRRLSFLKTSFSNGGLAKLALGDGLVLGGLNTNLASRAKALRQERDMLRKQMLKKLSVKERENLFLKWGIALDSKQRRQQLARCIWTETNMEHVRDSASLVAKLIGLLDPGHALKEIFLLNFNPQLTNLRSFSRKHSFSSFL